ncbi:vacuolar fusion protein CCZ1 homolog isoform X1 [Homarus americanus]|uniref:vacuolar fusion protein CCZ1 homolog isoform X1 n=1 Tax=Homarus americanus TaxID=6706 RepID=UPI001C461553|nr:vacuolar fusion protein CCZ1 homolog isoform X1 [Homarus americanus]
MSGENSSEPKILNLFIFNASYGQKEGHEHEKILFYHPSSSDLDTQVRQVGLAEAITRFSRTFKKDGDCEGVHTQKTRQVFYQAEPDVWLVLTVGIGWISKVRETGPVREYQSEGVQDVVLRARLISLYRSFTLQHASFASVSASAGLHSLRSTLNTFVNSYLSSVEMSGGDILAVWSGVSFLPLDRQTFLRIHCCLSLLQSSFPNISHTAFFYNHHVVWCGLGMEDLRSLSQYLNNQLLPGRLEASHQKSSSTPTSYLARYKIPKYKFVGIGVTPSIQIHVCGEDGELQSYHLLVYTLAGATVCLTLPETETLTPSIYEKIDRLLEAKVSQLASDIGEQINKKGSAGTSCDSSSSSSFRYVYHNHMNLATKTTVHGSNQSLPVEVMRTIGDMYTDMKKCNSGELVVKTSQDHWVVGRSGDGREFYVVVSHKNANLVEVTDEVNRMCASHFSNIFMIE